MSLQVPLIDWGLRDYGLEPQVWGGNKECLGHEWGEWKESHDVREETIGGKSRTTDRWYGNPGRKFNGNHQKHTSGQFCRHCGAWRGSYGLEPTMDCLGWATGAPCGQCYVCHTVQVFRKVRRVLRPDGTLFLNLGDSYYGGGGAHKDHHANPGLSKSASRNGVPKCIGKAVAYNDGPNRQLHPGLKPKDLCGVPWRVALALQADGWWLRSDIIWCLSGGTWLYVRTQKGDMPMMVRDVARLDPATVKLWNNKKWTKLLGVSQSPRQGNEIEMVLRSGERISCTPTHQWPTNRGLLPAGDIQVGDVLESAYLPEPENPKDCVLDEDAAWFAGLYIAEGSKAGDTIQIAGHSKETARLERVECIAAKFGGSVTVTVAGNKQDIRVYGKVLNAILDELVTGHTAKNKGLAPVVWRYSNRFIAAMVEGYLSGDGHYEPENNRWRLGFTRNYNLERDLRTACARLGYRLVLNPRFIKYNGGKVPTFRGELRKSWNTHHNQIPLAEVVEIRKARCRNVYDLGVEDSPHLFALASGVLTHNSKPNPMPESCTDRPTTAHEHIFLLTKSAKYFWDAEAVREDVSGTAHARGKKDGSPPSMDFKMQEPGVGNRNNSSFQSYMKDLPPENGRNLRNVWTIATAPFSDWFETVHQFHVERDAVSCGMKHKVSPDCPLHGGLLAQEPDEKGAHSPGQIPDRIVDISSLPISPECLCSYYQEETKKSSHFATFPPAIPERCIKAGTSERGCCGAMVKKLKVREDLTQEERLKVEAFLSSKGWL